MNAKQAQEKAMDVLVEIAENEHNIAHRIEAAKVILNRPRHFVDSKSTMKEA